MSKSIFYSDYSWRELKELATLDTIVILPVGSTEQHGPALPICTDDYMAVKWAEDAAKLVLSKRSINILVMPGIHYGYAKHHMAFPGTITLGFETLKQIVLEVGDSLLTHGFKKFIILNVHGGNRNSVRAAATDLAMKYARRDPPVRIRVVEDCDGDINPLVLDRASLLPFTKEASRNGMVHSGALETAKMLYLRPELCDLTQVNEVDIQPDRSGAEIYPYDVLTPYGALGKPAEATVEAGKIMWDALVQHFADAILKMADSR
jgi:creatinine amidohydrolase